jgi:hypothetical protein
MRRYRATPEGRAAVRESHRGSLARKLARGERISSGDAHHTGMAELKARLGDPRPEGMDLSLVRVRAETAYWGSSHGRPWLLSTDPRDYAYETRAQNMARQPTQRAEVAALGL